MINSLTGLRFYAAFLVFVHHAMAYFFTVPEGPMVRLGQLGVSIFFVLSGFVLFINYLKPAKKENIKEGETKREPQLFYPKKFYVARWARIYPVFLVTTLLAIPLQLFSTGSEGFWQPLFFNTILLHCFVPSACHSFNDVGWTLSVEAFFYMMFPFLALCFYGKKWWTVIIPFSLLAAFIIGFSAVSPESFYAQKYFPLNRLMEFFLGMCTGYYYLYSEHRWIDSLSKKINLKMGGLLLVLVMFVFQILFPLMAKSGSWADEHNYLAYMLPSAVIILTLALMEQRKLTFGFLASPLAVLGGEISYSFYLIHNEGIRYFRGILLKLNGVDVVKTWDPTLKLLSILFLLALTLGASYLLYRFIEIPFRKKIRHVFH